MKLFKSILLFSLFFVLLTVKDGTLLLGQSGESRVGDARPKEQQKKDTQELEWGKVIREIKESNEEELWSKASLLKRLPNEKITAIISEIKKELDRSFNHKLGFIYAVLTFKQDKKEEAWNMIIKSFEEVKKLPGYRLRYAKLMEVFAQEGLLETKEVTSKLNSILDFETDKEIVIYLAKALFLITADSRALTELKNIFNGQEEENRFKAAMALVDLDYYDDPRITDYLKRYAEMPTEKGIIAKLYLKIIRLNKNMEIVTSQKPSYSFNYSLIDKVLKTIKANYLYKEKFDEGKMLEACASGIARSLDPFCSYLDEKELKQLRESIEKEYGGIGAYVSTRDGWLVIERPVYSGPAYKAGLRSLDVITKIEDKTTKGKDINELVALLKGVPGTKVKITVERRGWTKPRDFIITREKISLGTAQGELLPADIGYINISSFSETTAEEIYNEYWKLHKEANGKLTGLILDLRNNPGGYLIGACEAANLFVEEGKLLLSAKGTKSLLDSVLFELFAPHTLKTSQKVNDDGTAEKQYFSTKLEKSFFKKLFSKSLEKIKLDNIVVLINEGSASASEIFAGILKDYKIAKIVGTKSYGKGSIQKLFAIKENDKGSLRLTIGKYYLPSGKTPDAVRTPEGVVKEEGGIIPDVEVKYVEGRYWEAYESEKLVDSGAINKYFTENYQQNPKLFGELAINDYGNYKLYPNFDKWYKTLKTKLNKSQVRRILRYEIRKKIMDIIGKELIYDLVEDIQLQKAIEVLLKQSGKDLNELKKVFHFLSTDATGSKTNKK